MEEKMEKRMESLEPYPSSGGLFEQNEPSGDFDWKYLENYSPLILCAITQVGIIRLQWGPS